MIAKRLLSETEEEYETFEGRRITIGVPSKFKNMIQKLIDDYAGSPTITATVLELGETNKDILNRLIYLSDYDELPDLILAADAVIVQIVEYNLSAFVKFEEYGDISEYQNFKLGDLYQSDNSIYGFPFNGMPMAFYEAEKNDGVKTQKVKIVYNCVGTVSVPNTDNEPVKTDKTKIIEVA